LLIEDIFHPDSETVVYCESSVEALTEDATGTVKQSNSSALCLSEEEVANVMSLCDNVYKDKFSITDVSSVSSQDLKKLDEYICHLKSDLSVKSRTARLWLQYMKYIDIVKLFLIAELTSNWFLHLAAVDDMLNLIAVTGQNNYAKCSRLYLQLMSNLSQNETSWLYQMFSEKGLHSIRRSDRYWAGLFSDLVIKQMMMRSLKSRGGLTRGSGMEESVRSVWFHTMHHCASIHLAMTSETDLQRLNQQHADLGKSRVARDSQDLHKILDWLKVHNPFAAPDQKLRSISSGMTANDDDKVTCDQAEEVGAAIHQKLDGQPFYEVTMKRSDQIRTLATLQKSLVVDKKVLSIDNNNLFHRLVIVIEQSGNLKPYFFYELTQTPSALFKDNMMRKADKPVLA